jgi:hypothetical protein
MKAKMNISDVNCSNNIYTVLFVVLGILVILIIIYLSQANKLGQNTYENMENKPNIQFDSVSVLDSSVPTVALFCSSKCGACHEFLPDYQMLRELRKSIHNKLNASLNFPIQSMAATIVNRAAIKIMEDFKSQGLSAYVAGQIHDEIVCRCPETELDKVMKHRLQNKSILNSPDKDKPMLITDENGISEMKIPDYKKTEFEIFLSFMRKSNRHGMV